MAKRKTGVNDIIYELDNDDTESSSEDEVKGNKKKRFETNTTSKMTAIKSVSDKSIVDMTTPSNSMDDSDSIIEIEDKSQNGGKSSVVVVEDDNTEEEINNDELDCVIFSPAENHGQRSVDGPETVILNEDITVDSPASINGPASVVGESTSPLITIRFRNNKLASKYKQKIKLFVSNLLLSDNENIVTESDTELDLAIWSDNVIAEQPKAMDDNIDMNLFFVDTNPKEDVDNEIPKYTQSSKVISNEKEKEPEPSKPLRKGPICFNCGGDHIFRDCKLPRNNNRIAENRKNLSIKHGRYHVEDDQKYGHLIPGRISNQLRHALGLKRNELPLHIYRMRMLGYPPGWLEEARISHSGISMFDSAGKVILDEGDEEGQICEAGSKDKFDIKKILDFPGFNVPASSRYVEQGHIVGAPPISEQDSKMLMLQTLAPNAMKAYKRKKLSMFPSGTPNDSQISLTEMELDSGDESSEFPLVPPLPDEEPPPLPPPPDSPPPSLDTTQEISSQEVIGSTKTVATSKVKEKSSPKKSELKEKDGKAYDKKIFVSASELVNIPVPDDDFIIIDEDFEDYEDIPQNSGTKSPSLKDLEDEKKKLLEAIKEQSPTNISDVSREIEKIVDETENEQVDDEIEKTDIKKIEEKCDDNANESVSEPETTSTVSKQVSTNISETTNIESETSKTCQSPTKTGTIISENTNKDSEPTKTSQPKSETDIVISETIKTDSEPTKTSQSTPKAGIVKSTFYGTPVLNVASPYVKLPSDDKFAKDICDVINFENLPNSTGKYKKICNLLKKVKSEVDRIQES
ncbi:PREDICTED: zinc finger CCHC domain-containing protein 8 homolog [Papilio xuthus]|uniref:Zinc finger CCHC domain-containing protein 8 homolog n=1 Tax=Papilio xuthus TaxID=66420 RepID=A0AAJ6ZWX1_PAPXU|nr:PREDICTED: zinc finger CCHC domain-containing protein 8 homolog [Papilio xuthus]